ncbi:DUF2199 domain-containing protein [Streptomyces sp. NPDC051677]|uniref:DUF2199 domain-containing protein n=1 Tax=Streptomyces sp. NPDC051677 TaxID=3365669 RepID=UPI0037D2EB68
MSYTAEAPAVWDPTFAGADDCLLSSDQCLVRGQHDFVKGLIEIPVIDELKRHVEAFPPVEVELPWGRPEVDGQRRKFSLLLSTRFGNAVAVNTWNTTCCDTPMPRSCWRPGSLW